MRAMARSSARESNALTYRNKITNVQLISERRSARTTSFSRATLEQTLTAPLSPYEDRGPPTRNNNGHRRPPADRAQMKAWFTNQEPRERLLLLGPASPPRC
jgi:hypothetical protein